MHNRLLATTMAIFLALMVSSAHAATKTYKHTGIDIPEIDTVVENMTFYVQLPSPWTPTQYQITYQLQGGVTAGGTTTWTNVFGTGAAGHATVDLSSSTPTRIDVVVPKFSISGVTAPSQYRVLFGTNYGPKLQNFQNLGTIALNDGTHSNSGSIPGYTYTLVWEPNNQIKPLTPNSGGTDALKKPANPPKLGTKDGKKVLMVWDKASNKHMPFFVRGMAYEVTPVGQPWPSNTTPSLATGESLYLADFNKSGGGQICSPLPSGPYGTPNQSYCFDTDLTGPMHSYLNNAALEGTEKPNALLPNLWERDFKMMKAMGVNMIRVYHIDALVRNMTAFLDTAYKYGIYVIMPAPAPTPQQTFASSPLTGPLPDWGQMTSSTNGLPWSALMQLALARYAAHPAILAWAVGNETEADNGQAAAAKVEWLLAKTIKDFDDSLLVTATNQDHYNSAADIKKYYEVFEKYTTGTETYLDFYSINSYRGIAPTALNLSGMQPLFNELDSLAAPYDLPLLISEWGKNDNYNWNAFDNQWGYARMWRMILTTKSDILGLAYFEFSDEPVAKNLAGQHYMGVVAYSLPDNYSPANDMVNDIIVPKFKDYDGIKIVKSSEQGKTTYYQNYPAVNMAGVFDSFIGSNKNPLTKDSAVTTVPNISYCAFSESPDPWSIKEKCLTPEATEKTVNTYTISITPAGSNTVGTITLNNETVSAGETLSKSGVLRFSVTGSGSNTSTVAIGFDEIGDIPVSNENTLLYQGFEGAPNISWQNCTPTKTSCVLTITLAPVGS